MSRNNISKISQPKASVPTVLVLGVFDGVHVGHQTLIRKAVDRARRLKCSCVVATFDPHPVHVLHPEVSLSLITSLEHRLSLILDLGVDACAVINFTKAFARQSAEAFVRKYLVGKFNACEIFVGDDFRFGKDRAGTLEEFIRLGKVYGFCVNVLNAVGGWKERRHVHKNISSSVIRSLIQSGQLAKAKKHLGRPVSIMGQVVKGDSRGRMLGFPTANIQPDHELIPPYGVYAVNILIDGKTFHGMANIGCRPSFPSMNPSLHIEVNIFKFDKNIYGQKVLVELIKKIREEKIFSSAADLVDQLKKDRVKAMKILG